MKTAVFLCNRKMNLKKCCKEKKREWGALKSAGFKLDYTKHSFKRSTRREETGSFPALLRAEKPDLSCELIIRFVFGGVSIFIKNIFGSFSKKAKTTSGKCKNPFCKLEKRFFHIFPFPWIFSNVCLRNAHKNVVDGVMADSRRNVAGWGLTQLWWGKKPQWINLTDHSKIKEKKRKEKAEISLLGSVPALMETGSSGAWMCCCC